MKLVFTPDWFTRIDILIEGFSFVVLFLFFIFALRSYKLSKNKKSLFLGLGFLFIALAEVSTILTKLVLFYDTTFTQNIGQMVVTYKIVKSIDWFYYAGFFIHKLFTLIGLYTLYRINIEAKIKSDIFLSLFFIIISAIFGNLFYYIFHLTSLIFLIMVIQNYSEVYEKNRAKNTKILITAFGMLALSQIIFLLSKIKLLYVTAQIIQLTSYIALLFLMIKISQYGKTKS